MPNTDAPKLDFLQYHKPGLVTGNYTLTVEQTVKLNAQDVPQSPFKVQRGFRVAGPRFTLAASDIHAVFPGKNSLADHARVLPQIMFSRSTLPWERQANHNDSSPSWLALLLFSQEEKPQEDQQTLQVLSLAQLQDTAAYPAKFPQMVLEPGQNPQDRVTVIDIPWKLLKPLLPSWEDLTYLSHVRRRSEEGQEVAVVIGHRLPIENGMSTVHLVSLENRYRSDGTFDKQGAADDDLIRLVSLQSWDFSCLSPEFNFKVALENLNRHPSTVRLPPRPQGAAEDYLRQGHIPLVHRFREGSQSVSWYHGPLLPGIPPETELPLPVFGADQLIRYDRQINLFDVSYAAAWNLGRLLMLQRRQLAVRLYQWKRAHEQKLRQLEAEVIHAYWHAGDPQAEEIPQELKVWFTDLSLLRQVPFFYLIPDANLLPPESIRFFSVDPLWRDALLDGAFSIGRVHSRDLKNDQTRLPPNPHPHLSGVIIRSEVISGWPKLLVAGYNKILTSTDDPADYQIPLLRFEHLSKNVLIMIFGGEVKTVDLQQKAEAIHSGVDGPDEQVAQLHKKLRNPDGSGSDLFIESLPWRDAEKRLLDISILAQQMKDLLKTDPFTSAQLAFQMIEGTDRVRFQKKDDTEKISNE